MARALMLLRYYGASAMWMISPSFACLVCSHQVICSAGLNKKRCVLVFYTTHKDMARIQALPHYEELRRHADVRFIFIDTVLHAVKADIPGFNFTSKYAAMTAAHNHSLRSAARNGRYVIINPPDSIWQKDTFVNLLQLQKQGKNNIFLYTGPFICRQYIDDIINKCMKNGIFRAR